MAKAGTYADTAKLAQVLGVSPPEVVEMAKRLGLPVNTAFGKQFMLRADVDKMTAAFLGQKVPIPASATVSAATALGGKGAPAAPAAAAPVPILPSDRMAAGLGGAGGLPGLGAGVVGAAPFQTGAGAPSGFYQPPGMYEAEGGVPSPVPGQGQVAGVGIPTGGAQYMGQARTYGGSSSPTIPPPYKQGPSGPPTPEDLEAAAAMEQVAPGVKGAAGGGRLAAFGQWLKAHFVGKKGAAATSTAEGKGAAAGVGAATEASLTAELAAAMKSGDQAAISAAIAKMKGVGKNWLKTWGPKLFLGFLVYQLIGQAMGTAGQALTASMSGDAEKRALQAQLELQKVLGGGGAAAPSFQDMVVQAMSGPAQMEQQANIGRRAQQPSSGFMWQ